MQPLPPGALNPPTTVPASLPTTVPVDGPSTSPTPAAAATPPLADARLKLPAGFTANVIATVGGARELVALPNGDLLVGTGGATVAIVPGAEAAGTTGAPATFATLSEGPAAGIAYGGGFVFVATEHHVFRIPYVANAQSGTPQTIAAIRSGVVAPGSDGDVHHTSSIAVSGSTLYVAVGSSCNACAETDPTRATVQTMNLDGSAMTTRAQRWRNAMALAVDPASGTVWAGGAGQDDLPQGHPYEFMDAVSTHAADADYGWPQCEENHVAYVNGANCTSVVVPALEFPAYSTIIGATFAPATQSGTYAFPASWRGGMFVSIHGSWHALNNVPVAPPHVAFVPFTGAAPARAVNWSDPTVQWNDFFSGFQLAGGARIGRPTGVALGPSGSLFVADDDTGAIYRIRPSAAVGPNAAKRSAH